MVLTVSFELFPVIGLCCHRRLRKYFSKLDASVEASEPHDFAVRITCRSSAARQRPLHPVPNVRDDRERPSMGRDGAVMDLIWGKPEQIYFCKWGWTGISRQRLSGKSPRHCIGRSSQRRTSAAHDGGRDARTIPPRSAEARAADWRGPLPIARSEVSRPARTSPSPARSHGCDPAATGSRSRCRSSTARAP